MEIEAFLRRCDAYCEQKQISLSRLSTILFGSGVTIDRLKAGKGVTVRVLQRAVDRLAEREKAAPPESSETVAAA